MSNISIKWNHRGAFRRFGLPVPANGDLYGALMAKILTVQSDFNESLAWKDAEGDMIVFSSTTELTEAINSIKSDEPLRVFTVNDAEKQTACGRQEKTDSETGNNVEHPNVMCDSCDGLVRGFRYKCMSCPDFDLCQTCEREGKHTQHPMARIADPNDRTWMAHHALFMRKMCKGMRHHGPWAPGRGPHHWWRHQMRQQQQQEGQTEQGSNNAPPQPADIFNGGMDFLREVGVTVAEALTNLGIAVDVDVEHDGAREKVAEPAKNKTQTTDAPKEQQQQQPTPTEAQQQEQTMPVDTLEQQMQQSHIDNNANGAQDWTMIEGTEPPSAPASNTDSAPQSLYPDMSASVHHPDPRVNKTLNDLMAMGFDNQDGWLQQLVETKRGDINAILNALQPRH